MLTHGRSIRFAVVSFAVLLLATSSADAQLRRCGKGRFWDTATRSCKQEKRAKRQSPESRYQIASRKLDSKRESVRKRAVKTLERLCRRKHASSCTLLGFLYRNGLVVEASARTALDHYRQACRGKDAQGCFGAARIFEDGLLGKPQHVQANQYLDKACELDHAQSCYRYAEKHEQELGFEAGSKSASRLRQRKARKLYEKAVARLEPMCPKDGVACYFLGKAYRDGKGVKRGSARIAFEYFSKGCDARSADACTQLARAYERGDGTSKDIQKANDVLERTCTDLDSPKACTDVGMAMTRLPKSARNPQRIKAVADRACKLQKKSCFLKGYLFGKGYAGPEDQRLAAKYYEISCKDGHADACRAVGYRYTYGDGVPRNYKKAKLFWKRGCEIGNADSCLVLAQKLIAGGVYGRKDQRGADVYALKACNGGNGSGCHMAGERVRDGKFVLSKVAPGQSKGLFAHGCRLEHGPSCQALGDLYLHGKLIPRNVELAVKYLEKGCDHGAGQACTTLAELYDTGKQDGVPKNRVQAAQTYARACQAGIGSACFRVNAIVKEVKPDRIVRNQLFDELKKACAKPFMRACDALGLVYIQGGGLADKDEEGGFKMFEKSCKRDEKDNGWACVVLGNLYAGGMGTRKDSAKAKALYARQCDLGNQNGCYWLAIQLFEDRSYADALGLFKKTCDQKNADACNFVGYMLFHGKGTQWDPAGAVPYYEKSCELGAAVGCSNVGELHYWGIGRKVDLARAYQLYQRACDESGIWGCGYVGLFHHKGLGGVEVDLDRAKEEYAKVCKKPFEWQMAETCLRMAELARERGKLSDTKIASMRTRARGLVEARAKEDSYGKYLLGIVYRDGIATVADPVRAGKLFSQSCEDKSVMGCITAGRFYLEGAEGLAPDRRKAESFFERACGAGVASSCEGAKKARQPVASNDPKVPLEPTDKSPGCACRTTELPAQGLGIAVLALFAISHRRGRRRRRARGARR